MDSWKLSRKVLLGTGASGGWAPILPRRWLRPWVDVITGAPQPDAMAQVTAAILAAGGRCRAVALDVADGSSIAALGDLSPRVDIPVNNAGVVHAAAALDQGEADLDRVIDTNFNAMFLMSRAVASAIPS